MNQTIVKFGYPETLIREYGHWVVLLRPVQATLGALIIACKDDATRYSEISQDAFAEMGRVIVDTERALGSLFDYQKLNYLMLMMVDPDVHYHVLPRYAAEQTYADCAFTDPGWPGPPNIGHDNGASDAVKASLLSAMRSAMG